MNSRQRDASGTYRYLFETASNVLPYLGIGTYMMDIPNLDHIARLGRKHFLNLFSKGSEWNRDGD
jgi:hypothetical protein